MNIYCWYKMQKKGSNYRDLLICLVGLVLLFIYLGGWFGCIIVMVYGNELGILYEMLLIDVVDQSFSSTEICLWQVRIKKLHVSNPHSF